MAKPREYAFGPLLTRPDDVEGWVHRAQLAVLNPGEPTLDGSLFLFLLSTPSSLVSFYFPYAGFH